MIIACEQCGRQGTLDDLYSGKKVRLRCPYCYSDFIYAFSGDGAEMTQREMDGAVLEAKRMARLIISEIKLYNQEKIEKARDSKEVLDMLRNELSRGKQHYRSRIASKLPVEPDYFTESVREILLAGKN